MEKIQKRKIAEIIDKPVRTIQYWTDQGIVIPEISPSAGKGKAREYSERNVIEFGMLAVMCGKMGFELYVAKSILDYLRWGVMSGKVQTPPEDFFTSPEWGQTKELACVIAVDHSMNDEMGGLEPQVAFIEVKKNDEFSSKYRDPLSSKGDDVFTPLARQIIFVGAIRNTALKMFGINLPNV